MDTETLMTIGGIAVLLVLSGIFSGSETALTAASQPRMHLLHKRGDPRAGVVTALFAEKEKMIGAILLGNNLVNILASALATSLLIGYFGEAGVVYATAAMTILILIFGEVMPKTYAFQNADRVALAIAPFFRFVVAVLAPVTHTIIVVITAVIRLLGIKYGDGDELLSQAQERLRGAIELHQGDAPAVRQERIMLR
ncbi:MAG: Mg2+/Co2+ transporter CorB, partial [Alphaproteobacteria bacterium]